MKIKRYKSNFKTFTLSLAKRRMIAVKININPKYIKELDMSPGFSKTFKPYSSYFGTQRIDKKDIVTNKIKKIHLMSYT